MEELILLIFHFFLALFKMDLFAAAQNLSKISHTDTYLAYRYLT